MVRLLKRSIDNSMWKVLIKSVREYTKPSIQAPVFVALEVAIECVIPFITAQLVNQIRAGCGIDIIIRYGLVLLVMASFSLTFGRLSGTACATAASGFARNLRKDMFSSIQSFSFENIDRFSASSLVTRLTTDITNVQMAYMMIIRIAIRCPLMLVFAVIMSFIMGGRLALIFAFAIPFLGFGLYFVIRKAFPIFKRVFRKYDELNRSIEENIQGIRVVKSFVREEYETQKFGKAAEDVCTEFTKAEKILAFNSPIMQFCLFTNMLFILTFGAYTIVSTQGLSFNVGQLSSLMVYSFQTMMSLMMLSMVFVMITIADESGHRIVEVLREKSALENPESPVYEVPNGSVDFMGVSFRYSEKAERMVLENIDLHIKSGETIGILGGTGSSKTSLVQLIPRLYDVSMGAIIIDGLDIRDYPLSELHSKIGMVLQKNELFTGTIEENLRWGKEDATREEIEKAAMIAQAHEFITSFPKGYETILGRGGINVSGGQKQRICIARALLSRPSILILDDSTSSVDINTERAIFKGICDNFNDTTVIIVTQRVSTMEAADMVVILERGRVEIAGTPAELIGNSEMYREIYNSQQLTS